MNTDYDKIEYIKTTITQLLEAGGFKPRVEYEQSLNKGLVFRISVDSPKLLIGRQGSTLSAIEHLIFAIVNRHYRDSESHTQFTIDIDDYRANREWQLKQQVKDAVAKLKYSQEPIILPPMPRHERRFVHTYIQQQFPHLTTESYGEEPNRSIKMHL